MKVEIDLSDELAESLSGVAKADSRTLAEFINKVLMDFSFGKARHLPPITQAEIDAYRASRGPKRINLTAKIRNKVFERDAGKCGYCEGQLLYDETWHIDHIVPVSRGGTNDEANLVLSCVACNLKKAAK